MGEKSRIFDPDGDYYIAYALLNQSDYPYQDAKLAE